MAELQKKMRPYRIIELETTLDDFSPTATHYCHLHDVQKIKRDPVTEEPVSPCESLRFGPPSIWISAEV